jgi:tetratricopeptide (TPR) repeat protein
MTEAPTTPDPIEMAMEADARGEAPGALAREVLRRQARLIGWEIADRRAAFGLKLLLGAAGLAVAALIAWACWDASRASGIVVEPFDTSPGLAAQGFTGEATAHELVSRLSALEAATSSSREERRLSGAADNVTLVIPQTGVSVGEAQRLLRAWLGHETHISGALRPAPNGLTLSVRIDGRYFAVEPPPPDQLGSAEAWLDRGAQAVMRETDAYRYASWLFQAGRVAESTALMRRITMSGSPNERAWAWSGLAVNYRGVGHMPDAIAAGREAVRLNPEFTNAWANWGTAEALVGRMEPALIHMRQAGVVARRTHVSAARTAGAFVQQARYENDWRGVEKYAEDSLVSPSSYAATGGLLPAHYARILSFVARHDLTAARLAEAAMEPPFNPLIGGPVPTHAVARERADLEDWAGLEAVMSAPVHAQPQQVGAAEVTEHVVRIPWRAYAVARQGRMDEARALLATTAADCYPCLVMRGRIEAMAGDPAAGDLWFAEARRQGPSLADAEQAWGEVKLARGDATGALALFQQAAKKAPGWAEPLKGEGDALVGLGRPKGALKVYAAAADRAPRWGGLRLAWGEALAKAGKPADAQKQWRAAAAMDLAPSERTRLAQVSR